MVYDENNNLISYDGEYNLPKYQGYEDIIEEYKNDWHIGQSHDHEPVKQLKCKICGSDKFEVDTGSYYVDIRCPICKYEFCIADGWKF